MKQWRIRNKKHKFSNVYPLSNCCRPLLVKIQPLNLTTFLFYTVSSTNFLLVEIITHFYNHFVQISDRIFFRNHLILLELNNYPQTRIKSYPLSVEAIELRVFILQQIFFAYFREHYPFLNFAAILMNFVSFFSVSRTFFLGPWRICRHFNEQSQVFALFNEFK